MKKGTRNNNGTATLGDCIRAGMLVVFLLGTLVFMYKSCGFALLGTFAVMGFLLSPLFLTKPARILPRNDAFLDPVNKGLSGNIFTEK